MMAIPLTTGLGRILVPEGLHDSSLARSARNGVKKKRSVPEGQDDYVGAAFDSITEVSTPNTIFVD